MGSLKELNVSHCGLTTLPQSFANLQQLTTLNIGINLFKALPSTVCKLTNLKVLDVGHYEITNEILESLDSGLLQLEKLESIDCEGCEALTSPPYAVCQQGVKAIKKYYKDLAIEKGRELPVITVAVIGKTMSGKTSLIRSLQSNKRELTDRTATSAQDETTKVFNINKLKVNESDLHIVDYGGQEIYHLAYQMVIKEKCLPLIVVNMEEYASIAASTNSAEACQRVCFGWLSHFYLACPRLKHPFLVVTHSDKFTAEKFRLLVTDLLENVETHRRQLLEEEEERFGSSSNFCKILHLINTEKPVFDVDHVFEFGVDPDQVSNIQALKDNLETYCQAFSDFIPRSWELMGNYFDAKLDEPFLLLTDIQKEFPDTEQLIVLRYMHNVGKALWFERDSSLKPYVFHQIPALTKMISLLFHHASRTEWDRRVTEFRPFRHLQNWIEKEKYEDFVSKFMESGIIDEAVLFHLFKKESTFSADVALAVLRAFSLLHGPISSGPRKEYIIPSLSTVRKDGSYVNDGKLQLRVEISFKGLALPEYVYQLQTVALLNMYTDTSVYKYVARNGAAIQHGKSTTHLVHSSTKRTATIQVSTSEEKELSASWQRLIETCRCILEKTTAVWKATRPIIKVYCTHCLFMRDRNPGFEVDPDWLDFAADAPKHRFDFVKCWKDKSFGSTITVPLPLRFPCHRLTDSQLLCVQNYLQEQKASRFPPYPESAEEGEDPRTATGSTRSPPAPPAGLVDSVPVEEEGEEEPGGDLSDGDTPPLSGAMGQLEVGAQHTTSTGPAGITKYTLQQKPADGSSGSSAQNRKIEELTKIIAANHETISSVCQELKNGPRQQREGNNVQDGIEKLQSQLNYNKRTLPEDIVEKLGIVDSDETKERIGEKRTTIQPDAEEMAQKYQTPRIPDESLEDGEVETLSDSDDSIDLMDLLNPAEEMIFYPPVPGKILRLISDLCAANKNCPVTSAVVVQDPKNCKNLLLMGKEAESIDDALQKAFEDHPGFTITTQNKDNSLYTIQNSFKHLLTIEQKSPKEFGHSEWDPFVECTCELIVRAKEKSKDRPTTIHSYFVVVPAHLVLLPKQREKYASTQKSKDMTGLQIEVEKKTTRSRFTIKIKDDAVEETFDLLHPPLISYRHWLKKGSCSSPKCASSSPQLCPHMCMNDIALLRLDHKESEEMKKTKLFDHSYSTEQFVKIKSVEELQIMIKHRQKITVGEAKGYLWSIEGAITERPAEMYGYHLSFVLTSNHALIKGDCGMIVYMDCKDGKQRPLGLFIGQLDTKKDWSIYQAIILGQALKEIEFDYPHHVERVKPHHLTSNKWECD